MHINTGFRYVMRDGTITGKIAEVRDNQGKIIAFQSAHNRWDVDGNAYSEIEKDIVALYVEPNPVSDPPYVNGTSKYMTSDGTIVGPLVWKKYVGVGDTDWYWTWGTYIWTRFGKAGKDQLIGHIVSEYTHPIQPASYGQGTWDGVVWDWPSYHAKEEQKMAVNVSKTPEFVIEEGPLYNTRGGEVVGPLIWEAASNVPGGGYWRDNNAWLVWFSDGRHSKSQERGVDIVSRVKDKNTKVKEQKVAKLVIEEGKQYILRNGHVTTQLEFVEADMGLKDGGYWIGKADGREMSWFLNGSLRRNGENAEDIISEYVEVPEIDSPILNTKTVTRTILNYGHYGRVYVTTGFNGSPAVGISVSDSVIPPLHVLTPEELEFAAKVFNELAAHIRTHKKVI